MLALARLRHVGPTRRGPWPGLTPAGALRLLAHALLLAGAQSLLAGEGEVDAAARSALPMLPLLALADAAVLVLAARMVGMPGAASAVCGAYLLPRSLVSLLWPTVAPPFSLLPPAMALDLALWLRRDDLAALAEAWPWPAQRRARRQWRRRERGPRPFPPRRAPLAGAAFGGLLALLEPSYTLAIGGDPTRWGSLEIALALPLCAALGAGGGWLAARPTEERGAGG